MPNAGYFKEALVFPLACRLMQIKAPCLLMGFLEGEEWRTTLGGCADGRGEANGTGTENHKI